MNKELIGKQLYISEVRFPYLETSPFKGSDTVYAFNLHKRYANINYIYDS